jgi:hypothetical protein
MGLLHGQRIGSLRVRVQDPATRTIMRASIG